MPRMASAALFTTTSNKAADVIGGLPNTIADLIGAIDGREDRG